MKASRREDSFMCRARTNKALTLVIILASLVLPVIMLISMTTSVENYFLNFINWLWIGFYSTILTILFVNKNILVIILMVLNIAILAFALFSSFLAGLPGLLYMVIKMLVPFIPDSWIGIELRP